MDIVVLSRSSKMYYYFTVNFYISIVLLNFFVLCYSEDSTKIMSTEERIMLRDQAKNMFYHAYNAYMKNAYPADELMPLSCKGRYRGLTPNRGDIDDCLGNFSLTLIDALDTLVILGDLNEFEHAVKLVIKDVSFENDVVVSVFETNIRVLGGLLSAHVLANYLQEKNNVMLWYSGELLEMAKDIGYRLLPAFNTSTGIPYSRVNLLYGIKSDSLEERARETCTACAGSMILEMAALSRLSGEPEFERKAQRAMDSLWRMRHRGSDLMGAVLNVQSGDWIRRESGVGAGIDSYYEYCLKAYVLLGDLKYLDRFNRHYAAVMKYVSRGPMLLDVHMHRPHTTSRNFMDALLAFWPGLQVLKGDIKPAVETHEMLYQVMQRHKFIPEAFTTDFQVHWGNHPLRPEFLESTYYLYEATKDPYYLEVGKKALESLQTYAKVDCGYAAVNDVRTTKQEDRMDSFVLSETFKYLYLLFAKPSDLSINLNEFIFTTEGHLLPLTLGLKSSTANFTRTQRVEENDDVEEEEEEDKEESSVKTLRDDLWRSCPKVHQLVPEAFRKPLKSMVEGMCSPRNGADRRRLSAREFSASNVEHLKSVKDMGISIIALNDGRVQLLHSFSAARSPTDAEHGLLFMQEMVELSKLQPELQDVVAQSVSYEFKGRDGEGVVKLHACPAQFGVRLKGDHYVKAIAAIVTPFTACHELTNEPDLTGKIALLERGECMFVEKARRVQRAGALGAIIIDNVPGSSLSTTPMFSMSGDGNDDVKIPCVFLYSEDARKLLVALRNDPLLELMIGPMENDSSSSSAPSTPSISSSNTEESNNESMFQKLKMSVQEFLNKHAGVVFTKTIRVGDLQADVGTDKIRITRRRQHQEEEDKEGAWSTNGNGRSRPSFTEAVANAQWSKIREGLLKSIEEGELFVPINILKIYHQTLSGNGAETSKNNRDLVAQTEWFLNQLMIERHSIKNKKNNNLGDDDSLIVLDDQDKDNVMSHVIQFERKVGGGESGTSLNDILKSMSELEKNNKNLMLDILKSLNDEKDEILENKKMDDNIVDDSIIKREKQREIDEL